MADCLIPVYLSASWKGMPFNVEASSDEFGRRGQVYEYPLGENTGYKDLGRKARRFTVEGYLIGGDQVGLSNAMAMAAESPQPGILIHPMFGPQLVACVTLTLSADYKTDVRRTKLSFDFVEAMPSMAPYIVGAAISALFAAGSGAVNASTLQATWVPGDEARAAATRVSVDLARNISPATDEDSFDAISMLQRGLQSDMIYMPLVITPLTEGVATPMIPTEVVAPVYPTFDSVVAPMDNGTATIRRIHENALPRLRSWNAAVVAEAKNAAVSTPEASPSIESMAVTARLAMIRDFALVAAQSTYATVRDALVDLDFVMAVYDEEEIIATKRCDDVLVTAIRRARASAAQTILAQNIRLPGISQSAVDGLWPSLVVSHKLYSDGQRYAEVESYNPHMSPFFVGRTVVAPSS